MPVKRIIRLRAVRGVQNDEGGALVAVIGAMAVVAALCATVLSASTNALSLTTSIRSDAQSAAASEAGIDSTELALRTGQCAAANGSFRSAAVPRYSSLVSYLDSTGWHQGCPDGHQATQVKVISTGYASAVATTSKMEAVYAYVPASATITGTGGAFFGGSTNSLNNVTVTDTSATVPGSSKADVVVTSGSFSCQGNKTIAGNLIVTNGSVDLSGCIVLGSIKASGYVRLNSGANQIGGNIVAAGVGIAAGAKVVTVNVGATVSGSVTSNGLVSLGGTVLGSVTALGSGVSDLISSVAKVGGNLTLQGTLNYGNVYNSVVGAVGCLLTNLQLDLSCALKKIGLVGGATSTGVAGLVAPVAPTAQTWPGYTYSAAAWTALGYQIVPWQGPCAVDGTASTQTFLKNVAAMTTNVVVDTRACGRVQISSSASLSLVLHSNVAFIGNGFSLEKLSISAATGLDLRAWVVVPGLAILPKVSLCLNVDFGGTIELNSNVTIGNGVRALLYTPGCVHNANPVVIKGQEYAGYVNMGESVSIDYSSVGLPDTSLDGTTVANITAASLGARTSLRELQN